MSIGLLQLHTFEMAIKRKHTSWNSKRQCQLNNEYILAGYYFSLMFFFLFQLQFVVTALHGAVALANPDCPIPKSLLVLFIPQDVFMFVLFFDFYRKAYWSKKEQ